MTLDIPTSRHGVPVSTGPVETIELALAGRRAVVTGADTALGRAVADAFRAAGAAVALVSGDEMPEIDLPQVTADIGDSQSASRVVESLVTTFGGLDVVALVPGSARHGARSTAEGPIDRMLNRTARPLFHLAEALRPHWHAGMSFIATAAIDPDADTVGDREARSSLETFTASLAMRMQPAGVRVNAVAPGSRHATAAELAQAFVRFAMPAPSSATGQLDVVG